VENVGSTREGRLDNIVPAADSPYRLGREAARRAVCCTWPQLADLNLSTEMTDLRASGIGGSDANVILSDDDERILRLWQEKRGVVTAEDLSGRLPVMLGCWTEEFNRLWYERISGRRIVGPGRQLVCATHSWRRCTVDGFVEDSGAVFEAKHTNSFVKSENVLERYMPQLQHNMAVAKVECAVLSVIFGNAKYEVFEVAADWLYQLDLFKAEQSFWRAVLSGEPPIAFPAPPAPRPIATRELSFEGNNAWAAAAADWLEHEGAAKSHASPCCIADGS
jgi:predicted phage-related endonuclease